MRMADDHTVHVRGQQRGLQIGTRLLFGGNLLRQPYMKGRNHRVVGSLENADLVTENTFWVGLYPGLEEGHLAYTTETLAAYVKAQKTPSKVAQTVGVAM